MFELLVILLLVLVNALLSGAEMAVVSARRAKLQAAADAGSGNAATVLRLRHDPERFLATVQVGITLVGAMAGAFGGASLTAVLTPWLAEIPGCAGIASDLAFGIVVGLITFLSVVFGELIPKSLALRHAESIALVMARPVLVLEWLARPVIWLLVKSSNLVLRPFHDSTNFVESKLSREDLAAMVDEATGQSDLSTETAQVLARAIDFSGLRAGDVMVPRRWVVALPITADEAALRHALLDAGHSRVPVYEGSLDELRGYVLREDVMVRLWDRQPMDLATLLRPAYFVPETMPAATVLRELQVRRLQLAIVVEESGGVSGIVTIEDLLEELVGEIFHERDAATSAEWKADADGAWLVPGQLGIRDFARAAGVELEAPDDVRTLSGLMVHLAGGVIPPQGAVLTTESGLRLEAVEVGPRRVRLVRVRPGAP
jgi:putative hemolysin